MQHRTENSGRFWGEIPSLWLKPGLGKTVMLCIKRVLARRQSAFVDLILLDHLVIKNLESFKVQLYMGWEDKQVVVPRRDGVPTLGN